MMILRHSEYVRSPSRAESFKQFHGSQVSDLISEQSILISHQCYTRNDRNIVVRTTFVKVDDDDQIFLEIYTRHACMHAA